MRLIDADALIKELEKDESKFDREACDSEWHYMQAMHNRANGIRDAIIEIYDAPTIDAVSVVRCKECKYRYTVDCFKAYLEYDIQEWIVDSGDDNDFCSYGEREDE